MSSGGPDPEWIRATIARVTAKYARPSATAVRKCGQPCWRDGPPCELHWGHPTYTAHVAPSVATKPGVLFDGPVPSSRAARGAPPYRVIIPLEGEASCTCPANRTYYKHADCSHIRLVREAIRLSEATP